MRSTSGGVSSCKVITVCQLERVLTIATGKYLPALKCLLALHNINPDHPKCHELGGRFKLALDNLSEPLPKEVQEVIQDLYLGKLDSKRLEQCNEEYLAKHKQSASHVQSVVRFSNALKPDAEETKSKGAKELQRSLNLPNVTLQEAQAGLELLDEIKAGSDARQAYLEAARTRWPEATAFKA